MVGLQKTLKWLLGGKGAGWRAAGSFLTSQIVKEAMKTIQFWEDLAKQPEM